MDTQNAKEDSILIIEQDHDIREMLNLGMTMQGYKIKTLPDANSGVEYYSKNKKDIGLVLMDIQEPYFEDLFYFEKLKSLEKDVKVIFVSSNDLKREESYLVKIGAKGVLQKPFTPKILSSYVKELFS